jgi:hypothetical protein
MPEGTVRHRFMMGVTLFKVEPRGIEPPTSAVQRRYGVFGCPNSSTCVA